MTSDVTLGSVVSQSQKTLDQSLKIGEDFSDFLTLLTTQLQHQDPLSPMDSSEFTNQIVQFSQVEQSINTNQKLDSLVQLQLSGISGMALQYVGLDVRYVSAEMDYTGTGEVPVKYSLAKEAVSAKINIYDEDGTLVFSDDAARTAGAHDYVWDGTLSGGGQAPEGTYKIKVDAFDHDDNPVTATTVVTGRVRGIETQNGVVFLLVGERAIPLSTVINATMPPAAAPVGEETT